MLTKSRFDDLIWLLGATYNKHDAALVVHEFDAWYDSHFLNWYAATFGNSTSGNDLRSKTERAAGILSAYAASWYDYAEYGESDGWMDAELSTFENNFKEYSSLYDYSRVAGRPSFFEDAAEFLRAEAESLPHEGSYGEN